MALLVQRHGDVDTGRAEERAGAGVHEAPHAVLAHLVQHIDRADQVHFGDAPRRVRVALRPGGDRRQVDDLSRLVLEEHLFEPRAVGHVAFLGDDFPLELRRRRREVVEHHLFATRRELLGDVQADEAGAARDQDHFLKPRMLEAAERGSRRPARPCSTFVKKSNSA